MCYGTIYSCRGASCATTAGCNRVKSHLEQLNLKIYFDDVADDRNMSPIFVFIFNVAYMAKSGGSASPSPPMH